MNLLVRQQQKTDTEIIGFKGQFRNHGLLSIRKKAGYKC